MHAHLLLAFLLLQAGGKPPESALTAEAIMSRVAENQDKAEKLRSEYVYRQRIHIATRKPNGKIMRDETADYQVMPSDKGIKKQMENIFGLYRHKKQIVKFNGQPVPERDSLDGDLVSDFRSDLMNDNSKDGLGHNLFPLTSEEQKKYEFRLLGSETRNGRELYRISFRPLDKSEIAWVGQALIDAEDFAPVSVFTKLSRRIPFAVRALLGTDVPDIGFNVDYRRQADGVWFPVSFGTEFRLRAVFFIKRNITISLENSDFERTHVESRITSVEMN